MPVLRVKAFNAHAHDAHPVHAGGCAVWVRVYVDGCAGRLAIPRVNAGDAHLLVWGRGCGHVHAPKPHAYVGGRVTPSDAKPHQPASNRPQPA
jgi:hypothetical protein